MLKFAKEEDLTVHRFELFNGATNPQARFRGIPLGWIGRRVSLAKERRAEGGFAMVRAKYPEPDGVKISAKEGPRLVASSAAQ